MVYLQVKRKLNVPFDGVSGAANVHFAYISFPFHFSGCLLVVYLHTVMRFRRADYISLDVDLPSVG